MRGKNENEEVSIVSLINLSDSREIVEVSWNLPFVKKDTSLWEIVQSFKVFQQKPQKPDFRPLLNEAEGLREGIALGWMVNYSNTVEKIYKLRYDDRDSMFSTNLELIPKFEQQGFDIVPLEKRLRGLLSTKATIAHLELQLKETRVLLKNETDEKARMEEDIREHAKRIDDHDKRIKELVKMLSKEKARK
ncbi:DUF724 domain-containing protein 5-like [Rutidosis leptorrhynchoides]|uniref:DUF724 domain-containing protein 5-like n=1 Tax=Rutidosis leptorrhynchoides TaxID=125765 RepID=UPI003A99F8E7